MKKFFTRWAALPAPKQAALILIGSGLAFTFFSSVGVVIVQPVVDTFFTRHAPD